jgi:hypothetical protein
MKDYGLDKGLIQFRDDEPRSNRGLTKGFFGFRKMFRDYLTKLNVAFYDVCCPELTGNIFPLRFNAEAAGGEEFEYFNGESWVTYFFPEVFVDPNTIFAELNNWVADNGIVGQAGDTVVPLYDTGAPETVVGGGFLSSEIYLTRWEMDTTSGTLQGSNQVGRMKKVLITVDGGDTTLTVDGGQGFSTIDFTAVGDYAIFIATPTGGWALIDYDGAITINP